MIRYAPEARADVLRLHAFQKQRSSALASRWRQLLDRTERRIAERPHLFPPSADGEARKCLMRFGRSVYVVHFVIDGDDQIIVRLWHGRESRR